VKRRWRRHECPPSVEITITINGVTIVGPMSGEMLAYVARYHGGLGYVDMMEDILTDKIESVHFYVKYIPPVKR
jgi:hypothetical protein